MDWGNVFIEKVTWNESKTAVTAILVKLNLDGDFKKTSKKLTWLASPANSNLASTASTVPLLLLDYDYLITKKKLEDEDNVENFVTPVSEFKVEAVGDANLKFCAKGDIIQLERKGYYIVDVAYDASKPSEPIHLISIPDGRVASTVSKNAGTETSKPAANGDRVSKKAKKAAVAAESASSGVPKINMYNVKPVYDNSAQFSNTVGGMYKVNSFYGNGDLPAAQTLVSFNPFFALLCFMF
jgi:glutamyl-tRNA synthetase